MQLVSIICPLYNKKSYIKETLMSVVNQLYTDWELLIIDDGSTDGSYELVQDYISTTRDCNIKLFRREQFTSFKGASACRNIGITLSAGEYILFLDADDILLDYCLLNRIRAISKFPGYSYYVFNVAYFTKKENQDINITRKAPSFWTKVLWYLTFNKKNYCLKQFLKFNLLWHTSGPIWKKEALLFLKGFNEQFQRLQDPEIHTRALLEKELTFKCMRFTTKYDVLHRMDDDRIVWDYLEFLRKQTEANVFFVNFFLKELKEKNKAKYISKLQGYLLWKDTVIYRAIQQNVGNQKTYIVALNDIQKGNMGSEIETRTYRFFVFILQKILKNNILLKLKVPGVLIYLYKKIL
ncbi:glycosyltransferase family 2 protein [Olivibacter jilunii]|uniref:glycosyltransferase family 2 protein n=1 Tax=Olivibacter jilunii TaxID=985016 RepID=UPI003F13E152